MSQRVAESVAKLSACQSLCTTAVQRVAQADLMTTAEPVVVVAHWQTTEASLAAVLAHIAALGPQSLAEPGCVGYEAFQRVEEPTHLLLIEHYRDGAALEAHLGSAHYQELVAGRIRPLLTDRRVEFLRPREAT